MKKLRSILGYSGAILTVAVMAISPFLLYGWFQKAIAGMGLRIHPEYSGGQVAETIARPGYKIAVHERVGKSTPWQRIDPFVQIDWTPAEALPAEVSEDVDLNGDGAPDVRVNFRPAELKVNAKPLDSHYHAMHSEGVTSFSALIAKVDRSIVVRVPVD